MAADLDALKNYVDLIRSWNIRTSFIFIFILFYFYLLCYVRYLNIQYKCRWLCTEPQEGLQYDKPTLFVGGAESPFIKPEYHGQIHAFFPNAKIEMIAVLRPLLRRVQALGRFFFFFFFGGFLAHPRVSRSTFERFKRRTPTTGSTSRSRTSSVTS